MKTKKKAEESTYFKKLDDGQFSIEFSALPREHWYADLVEYRERGWGGIHDLVVADELPFTGELCASMTLSFVGQWWDMFKEANEPIWERLNNEIAAGNSNIDTTGPHKRIADFLPLTEHKGTNFVTGTHVSYFGEFAEIQTYMFRPSAMHRLLKGEAVPREIATYSDRTLIITTSALYWLLRDIFKGA